MLQTDCFAFGFGYLTFWLHFPVFYEFLSFFYSLNSQQTSFYRSSHHLCVRVCASVASSLSTSFGFRFSMPNFQHKCTSQFQSRRRFYYCLHRLPFSRCHRLRQLTFFRRFDASCSSAVVAADCNIIIIRSRKIEQKKRRDFSFAFKLW